MQGLYGTVVLLITFSRMLYFRNLDIGAPKDDKSMPPRLQKWMWTELLLKAAGLILSITVFPPAASIAVLFALLVLVIPNQLRNTTII